MRFVFLTMMFTGLVLSGISQRTNNTSSGNSDPSAKVLLDKLKSKFDSYKSMEMNFEFQLELPGKPIEIQKGKLIQDGKKYAIVMKDQEIYADGSQTWLYLKSRKEVQISDFEDGDNDAFLSPKQMLALYSKGDYEYAIAEERKIGKSTFTDIEFKPLKKNNEITKLRLTINITTNNMVSLRVFLRDGNRYLLKMDSLVPNKKYTHDTFILNTKELKGVHIEDLRME